MKKILLLIALVSFTFMNAQVTVFEDDFESYTDFEVAAIGDWTQIDVDGNTTYSIDGYSFDNQGYTGTGIIFNSSQAVNATTNANDLTGWESHAGAKGLYFFAATSNPNGTAHNDDYMITPQIDLSGLSNSSLGLWVKSITDQYGLEKFELLVSTTGNAAADFTDSLLGVVEAPTDFTELTIDLSAYDNQQIYIAIHYIADDSFVLMVDDFKVTADSSASVNDNILSSAVSIFPNVATDNFTIKNTSNIALTSVSLFDINGRVVSTTNLNNLIGEKSINVSNLSAGMYFVEINSADAKITRKLIKK